MLDSNVVFNREDLMGKLNRRSVDPSSPAPLYYQLYTMLRDAIASGALQSGSRMPSEKELAATFDVSRNTARRALADLANEKMVVRRRGRGTVVDYGIEIARIEQYLSAERATPEVAKNLGIGTGKPLLKRSRYSYNGDGELVDFLTGLYNPDLFSYKMEADLT